MKATYKKAVASKTEAEKQVEATAQTIRTKSRNTKTVVRAAAVIIPLIALSYLSISQQERINNVYTQMATLNPFTTTSSIAEVAEVITKNDLIIEIAPEIIETPIIEEVENPVFTKQKTYYIIAGAFSEQKNANRMLNKLKRWNYNTEIVEGENLLRVSYDSFTNREDAVLALNKIKQENSDAWLLTK
jgi:cell division protein FtsN